MAPPKNRIDVHHHIVPPFYRDALISIGGDPSGWPIPAWDLKSDAEFSASRGITATIFSLTSPGTDILQGEAALRLARDTNEYLASIRDQNPSRYGFFAAVPALTNVSAAIAEITYALDVLKADGVTLFTRYGSGYQYLGDAAIAPVWDFLDSRAAVVFVHPTTPASTELVNPLLPQPLLEFPQETARTAMDLIVSDTLRTHPNCKVILSHAGGTLPVLAKRAAYGLGGAPGLAKSSEQILAEIATFYFDLALSSSAETVGLLRQLAKPDHIFYGSDYPYAPPGMISAFGDELDKLPLDAETTHAIDRGNALKLFPRFAA